MNPIKHVAIIMDGNGRWGVKHKQSRNAGHRAGLNTVDLIINHCINHKIKFLTLYTFSSENWKRPKTEIAFLFKLFLPRSTIRQFFFTLLITSALKTVPSGS